jgi:hypothetical protein
VTEKRKYTISPEMKAARDKHHLAQRLLDEDMAAEAARELIRAKRAMLLGGARRDENGDAA